jgi:hypothetical protein
MQASAMDWTRPGLLGRNEAHDAGRPAGNARLNFRQFEESCETGAPMLGLMQNRPLLISNLVVFVSTWDA